MDHSQEGALEPVFEKILIADDSMLARKMLVASIQSVLPQAEIDTAVDGVDAVERMIDAPAEVVFVDYNMPKMNGIDVIIKMAEHFPNTHFALVTANTQKALESRLEHLNVTIILKPINRDKIASYLDDLGNTDG